jgi:hypothetical protein
MVYQEEGRMGIHKNLCIWNPEWVRVMLSVEFIFSFIEFSFATMADQIYIRRFPLGFQDRIQTPLCKL